MSEVRPLDTEDLRENMLTPEQSKQIMKLHIDMYAYTERHKPYACAPYEMKNKEERQ